MKNSSESIVVGLSGGLGNQMFQYAAGRSMSARLNLPLILDLSWFSGQQERGYALWPFNIEAKLKVQYPSLPRRLRAFVSKISRRFAPSILGSKVWREPHFHYVAEFETITKPVYLEGYWQCEKYFQDIRPILSAEFLLKDAFPAACDQMLAKIRSVDAICVHIRRGDYLSNPVAARMHGTCSEEYYSSGVNELSQGLDNPHCFVFSDDPTWVRESLCFDVPMTVVDINGPNDAHLDLMLMKSCQYFLIANSTLSWWGAWLCESLSKKVIAPHNWFRNSDKSSADLIPPTWSRR